MLPLFFIADLPEANTSFLLPEETARHLAQVLRKTAGYEFFATDGRGRRARVVLEEVSKKSAQARVLQNETFPEPHPALTLAVAFTKAAARNEWLLEKAAELGTAHIIPLLCRRSESEKFRKERWQNILVSALQQSHQCHLPVLHEPAKLEAFLKTPLPEQRFVAHCLAGLERNRFSGSLQKGENACLLIGPEGDFTPEEIQAARQAGFQPVTLGQNRLRTETAAIAGASYFRLLNDA